MATKVTRVKSSRKHADGPGVRPDDSMSEAGRKVLAFHFKKLAEYEPGVRAGTDRDAIHDMRVTSRRLRSMLRLFGPFYPRRRIKPFAKMLRELGMLLGDVRDLDVLQIKVEKHIAENPEESGDSLNGLLNTWREQ